MADVDLIPADYAKVRRVERRVRQLLIACVVVVAVVGAVRLALSMAISFERLSIVRLEAEGQTITRSKAEADDYRRQKLLAEKQLAELDELRGRDRLRLLLQAIDAAYSDSIWFDELHFFRSDQVAAGRTSSLPGGAHSDIIVLPATSVVALGVASAPTRMEQRAQIVGHAMNHTRLAEFMRGMSSQPGIIEVRLLDTGLGSYNSSPVVDVTLLLLVDDEAGKSR